jgi:hypothetical protein
MRRDSRGYGLVQLEEGCQGCFVSTEGFAFRWGEDAVGSPRVVVVFPHATLRFPSLKGEGTGREREIPPAGERGN